MPHTQLGRTALHCAAAWGFVDIVTLLLAVPGVDPAAKDVVSRTLNSYILSLSPLMLPLTTVVGAYGTRQGTEV